MNANEQRKIHKYEAKANQIGRKIQQIEEQYNSIDEMRNKRKLYSNLAKLDEVDFDSFNSYQINQAVDLIQKLVQLEEQG